jgi:DNA-binding beta-propeller fold protein YncE
MPRPGTFAPRPSPGRFSSSLRWFALIAVAVAATGVGAAGKDALLILSKGDLTLSVVDPATLSVVGRVPSGPDPHEVAATPDGRTAYIANYHGGVDKISVVDLAAMKALEPIEIEPLRAPHGLVVAGGKLWFTAEQSKAIGRYDPSTKSVDLVLGTEQDGTHMIHVADDLSRVVTTNIASASVTIIEHREGSPRDWEKTAVPVGKGAEGFDVSPDRTQAWVANAQDGTISVIDLAAKKVIDTLAADVTGANRLAFTPDGKRVLVTTLRGPDLVVLDAATRKPIKRVKIGTGAAGLVVQPDGKRAFAACTPDNYVAVVDLATLEMTGKIDAGKNPDGMAWTVRP